jgi:hypothetical protein
MKFHLAFFFVSTFITNFILKYEIMFYSKNFKTQLLVAFSFVFVLFSMNSQTTRLSDAFCDGNINSLGTNLTSSVNRGQGHRFEVSKTDGTILTVYDAIAGNQLDGSRSRYALRLTWLSGCNIGYNFTYRIRVSWFNGSVWSAYGSYCQVTTPNVPLVVGPSFCGTTVSSLGVNILASTNQMCGHRWEVRDLSNNLIGVYDALSASVANPGRSAYNFRFSWMPVGTIQNATTYQLRVAYYDATTGNWSAYGPSCNVTTPVSASTQLTPAWCGNTNVPSAATSLTCNTVTGAVQYQFTVSATGYGTVGVLTKSSNSFRLDELSAPHPITGLNYDVVVRTRNTPNGIFSDPGNSCLVRVAIPTTTMSNSDCGRTINYLQQDTLHANVISGVEAYRYRIVDGGTTIIDSVMNLTTYNGITLRKFPGIEYCTTYQISVQVRINGSWSDWGTPCSISTVCEPITELRDGFINSNIASCATNLYVNSIVYATPYQYRVTGPNVNEVVEMVGSQFRLSYLTQVANLVYGSTYSIECRVFVNGAWCPWGPARNVNLQIPTLTNAMCGVSVPTMSTNVYCTSVACATDYRFRINGPGMSNVIHNPTFTNYFRPSQLVSSGMLLNSTYSVEVSVLSNGSWSNYGNACNITTPAAYITSDFEDFDLINEKEDEIEFVETSLGLSEFNENTINLYPNPSNSSFRFSINEFPIFEEKVDVSILNSMGQIIEKTSFKSIEELENYSFGENFVQGIYIVNLKNGANQLQKRIVKLK